MKNMPRDRSAPVAQERSRETGDDRSVAFRESLRWSDRILSHATLYVFIGIVIIVFALPALIQIGAGAIFSGSWAFSDWPTWAQVLTILLGGVCIVLELCFHLWRGGRSKKSKRRDPE